MLQTLSYWPSELFFFCFIAVVRIIYYLAYAVIAIVICNW